KSALPEHVIRLLDLGSLKRLPDSYVSSELEKTMSDVVYTCRRSGGNGRVTVCLLVEHKSYRDNYTPVQIGSYLFSGYQHQIRQGRKRLTPIIPVLFYHGKQKWEYWTLDRLFDGLGDELLDFIPDFSYVYHNLRDTPDAVVEALHNQFLASSLLMLKHSHDKAWLDRNLQKALLMALLEACVELQQAFLTYSFVQIELTDEQILEIITELPLTIEDKVMSTYDLLIAKGIEKGIERGIERGRNEERIRAQRLIAQERAKVEQERAKVEQERARVEQALARAYADKLESALKMKRSGFDNATIAEMLTLPIEEVEKLDV